MRQIVRKAKFSNMSIPFPVIAFQEGDNHCFQHTVHSLDGISLGVIRGYRRMLNSVLLCSVRPVSRDL